MDLAAAMRPIQCERMFLTLPARRGALHEGMRAAEVATLYRNVGTGVAGATMAALVCATGLVASGVTPAVPGIAWAGYISACAACHLGLMWRRRRAADADRAWRGWAAAFSAVALAEGVGWGLAFDILASPQRYDQQLLAMLATYCVAGGAAPAFGSYLPAFWCFFLPATLPFVAANLWQGGGGDRLTAGLLAAVYVVGMGAVGRRTNAEFEEGLRLRLEVDALAAALRTQKEAAEAANLAKSRFLAAASHDLRQPVHALSLSVGALQAMPIPAAARALAGHIESSVETLDALFTALLDVSRLDAAAVTPGPRAFAIGPLLARVCRDHAAEAAAKGVSLRLVPCGLAVRTDPVLLDRVVRNLIGNAVRYTGGARVRPRVLVGCRRRGGRLLQIEVWDTGCGIPPALHERVFEEFFQVDNPARDRSAGLGLGLAIVRRLTRLLDLPLAMRSAEGRGTVFALSVPVAARPEPDALPEPAAAAAAEGALILVIDNEAAIQAAMRSLLLGWGFRVIVAGSGAEMLERVATCPAPPALLLCDYRLGGGEDGIATIQRLQEEYNDELPAVLITGDTGPERLAEARASGLPLLHKPVEPGRLRRAIDRHAGARAAMPTLSSAGSPASPPPPPGSG